MLPRASPSNSAKPGSPPGSGCTMVQPGPLQRQSARHATGRRCQSVGAALTHPFVPEVREETGLDVRVDRLTGVYKNLHRGVVALVFRCSPLGIPRPGQRRGGRGSLGRPRRDHRPDGPGLRGPRHRRLWRHRRHPRPRRRAAANRVASSEPRSPPYGCVTGKRTASRLSCQTG